MVNKGQTIRRGVIPVAGAGSRLAPLTSVLPKAFFPLVDASGKCRPVLHWILAEAAAAGIEEAAIIVSPAQEAMVRQYVQSAGDCPPPLPGAIRTIVQPNSAGFGDAVLRARQFTAGEPFLLLLGDHVYVRPPSVPPCVLQVKHAFEQWGGCAMIGVQQVDAGELSNVGVVRGESPDGRVYLCGDFVEKPDLLTARSRLRTDGLKDGRFLAHCGIYALGQQVFDCLSELADRTSSGIGRAGARELQLSDAQSLLLSRHGKDYRLCEIEGAALDMGTPQGYARTQGEWGKSNSPRHQ